MVALAATLHDPEGRLLPVLVAHCARFRDYAGVVVAATAETDVRVVARLREHDVMVLPGERRIGVARRSAVAAALAVGQSAVIYCDFDRWLHWSNHFPDELAAIDGRISHRRPRPWYVCLGRTARAFATHPEPQRMAEGATNRALSLLVGRRLDATAGACWLSREGAEVIVRESVESTNATDLEWPALIHRTNPRRLGFLANQGLEFETATFYPNEIAAAGGRAAWIHAHYDRPEVWQTRLRLATDSVAAACRVLGNPGEA